MNRTGTCSTGAGLPTAEEILSGIETVLAGFAPEPFGEFMRSKGRPPEQWVLIIPQVVVPDGTLLPKYVVASSVCTKPVFLRLMPGITFVQGVEP